jgi:hypothetical protein
MKQLRIYSVAVGIVAFNSAYENLYVTRGIAYAFFYYVHDAQIP